MPPVCAIAQGCQGAAVPETADTDFRAEIAGRPSAPDPGARVAPRRYNPGMSRIAALPLALLLAAASAPAAERQIPLEKQAAESDLVVVGSLTEDPVRPCGGIPSLAFGVGRLKVEKVLKGDPAGVPGTIPMLGGLADLAAETMKGSGVRSAGMGRYLLPEHRSERSIFMLRACDSRRARSHPDEAIYRRQELKPSPAPAAPPRIDETEAETLVRDLGSSAYAKRKAAEERLRRSGAPHWKLLERLARETSDTEVRMLLGEMLSDLEWDREVGPTLWVLTVQSPKCVHPATDETIRKVEAEILKQRPSPGPPREEK